MEPANEPEPEEMGESGGETSDESSGDDDELCARKFRMNSDTIASESNSESGEQSPHSEHEAADANTEENQTGTQAQEIKTSTSDKWRRFKQRWPRRKPSSGENPEGVMLVDDEADPGSQDGDTVGGEEVADSQNEMWQVVDREGIVLAEENSVDCDPLAKRSVEAKVEKLLTWMLTPAIHGIPKLGVPSAVDRADELLASTGRNVDAAVREVVAGSERTVSLLVLNFCLERIPVLGVPTVLLRTTWGNLRSILIVAALYGHDIEAPRVQHEALLCLVPASEQESPRTFTKSNHSPLVGDTAQKVAKLLIKGALRGATGLQAAVDCFELAALLYNTVGQDSVDEDGFVHVMATPASTARDFFRKKSLASCALLWCSLPLLLLGSASPGVFVVMRIIPVFFNLAQALFRCLPRICQESVTATVLAVAGIVISLRTFWRLVAPRRRRRGLVLRARIYLQGRKEVVALQDIWPQILTAIVFSLHAVLPAISAYTAAAMILNSWRVEDNEPAGIAGWEIFHRVSTTALGLYSSSSLLVLHLQDDQSGDEEPQLSKSLKVVLRTLRVVVAASRGCCVLAAWTYASLALDFIATGSMESFGMSPSQGGRTALGVVGPLSWLCGADDGFSSLYTERSLAFTLNLVSVASQQRLAELFSRREVLLRLIGAEKMMASTLCLLFKGVAVACSSSTSADPIGEFLTSVAPPAWCCVLIVSIRDHSLILGNAIVVLPVVITSGLLGSTLAFIFGIIAGAVTANSVACLWYSNRAELDSPAMRLAILIPGGVSARAKGLLRGAFHGVRARALQLMTVSLFQRLVRWWSKSIVRL